MRSCRWPLAGGIARRPAREGQCSCDNGVISEEGKPVARRPAPIWCVNLSSETVAYLLGGCVPQMGAGGLSTPMIGGGLHRVKSVLPPTDRATVQDRRFNGGRQATVAESTVWCETGLSLPPFLAEIRSVPLFCRRLPVPLLIPHPCLAKK